MSEIAKAEQLVVANRPKILLLITNLDFGGAQRVFHYQSEIFSRDYDVIECVFNLDSAVAFPGNNKLINLDVKAGKNVIDKFVRFWERVEKLGKIKKDLGISVCISHMEGADLVNILSKGKEKTVSWVHGSKRFDENISGIIGVIRQKLIIPYIYSRSDLVVTVSQAIGQELIDHYKISPTGIRTMYNLFDTKVIQKKADIPLADQYEAIFKRHRTLLFSGRLAAQKNLKELLSWFSLFENSDCSLIILGDGEKRKELLEVCSSLGIRTYHPWGNMNLNDDYKVYFLGFQDNPYSLVKKADIFILPSLWEGFPMALGEAMACGVPVATADCPTGPREMLQAHEGGAYPDYGKFGILLPLLNPESYNVWTRCIQTLLSDEIMLKRYQKQSLIRAEEFSITANANKIHSLVDGLLNEKTKKTSITMFTRKQIKKWFPALVAAYNRANNRRAHARFKDLEVGQVFTIIYKENHWKDSDSKSGPGSNETNSQVIVNALNKVLNEFSITSILDVPCGDFFWMKNVDLKGRKYLGADIVEEIIDLNNKRYHTNEISFEKMNLIDAQIPKVDLVFCRDCLVHFSYDHIKKAIQAVRRSESKYFMTTNFSSHQNYDIITGDWRPLNLQAPPFNFPKPIMSAPEQVVEDQIGEFKDKSIALWEVSQIPE